MCATFPNPQDCLERTSTDISSDVSDSDIPPRPTTISTTLFTLLLPPAILSFSLHFPFVIPGVATAAKQTYIPASYYYTEPYTKFDNSIWTYGTDYALTFVMMVLAYVIYTTEGKRTQLLKVYSASLLVCYGISTLAGGYAHQTILSMEALNTPLFRFLWIICVGNVSFASCWMGFIGREIVTLFSADPTVPRGSGYIWPYYGLFMALATALGYMSFKRPACDIFIAGITQFPSTFYCLGGLFVGCRNHRIQTHKSRGERHNSGDDDGRHSFVDKILLRYKIMYYIGFIGNAPLLPMYPLLVQYTDMTLSGINTLLHSWLMVMWGMQGLSLLHFCRVIGEWEKSVGRKMD